MKSWHCDHHNQVSNGTYKGLHWTNLFLFFDSWRSTADQWATEVVPTLLFAAITGEWWVVAFYYIWAAFIQEAIEHNSTFNIYPFLTSGLKKINFALYLNYITLLLAFILGFIVFNESKIVLIYILPLILWSVYINYADVYKCTIK